MEKVAPSAYQTTLLRASANGTHLPSKVLYFGFDAAHTSIRRRMRQIGELTQLVGLTFRRTRYNTSYVPQWDNIDLGVLKDGQYAKRLFAMANAFRSILTHKSRLRDAELIVARNLDLLALALLGRAVRVFKAPIVYDVFDVRSVLLKDTIQAKIMRSAERFLLERCALLVVSSPGFIEEYFEPYLGYKGPSLFLENKVDLDILPDDPAVLAAWQSRERARIKPNEGRFVLGWVGAFRCARSAAMLCDIGRALPWLDIQISGKPTYCPEKQFTAQFADIPNIAYTGEYWFPTGLYDVYRGIDLNWDFDLSKHGASGGWLLPNRLYEGGYFGVPHLAEAGSQTGNYVEKMGIGWTTPADTNAIIEFLTGVRQRYDPIKQHCLKLMDDHFHYDRDIIRIFDAVAAEEI